MDLKNQTAIAAWIATSITAPLLTQTSFAQTTADETGGTSLAQAPSMKTGNLNEQRFAASPELGVISYGTPRNGTETRGVIGLGFNWNAVTAFTAPEERTDGWSRTYIGPQTGFYFAHTGSNSANFVGTSGGSADLSTGGSFMYIPLDLKAGYALTDNFRLSVHGGGNLTYQSIYGTVNLSNAASNVAAGTSSTNSSWNIYPNVGGDLEWGVGRNVAVLVRPDVMFSSGSNPFTGTVGVELGIS